MSWIAITLADLDTGAPARLVEALRTRALAVSQDDPAPQMILDVIAEVRRKIASNRRNSWNYDPATVPASLRRLTIDLVIFELKGRLAIALSEDERARQKRHERTLDRIADGTDAIDSPDTEAAPATQSASGTPTISTDGAAARRQRREGL